MLLRTKLHIPLCPATLLSRPRLVFRGRHRLTLVSAPAGFGKTTLLSAWAATRNEAVAWLSLDEGDNHPLQFWTYVVAALQTVVPGIGQETLNYLQTNPPPAFQVILTALLNELSMLSDPIVLVLDDYHVIRTPAIHEGVAFVLEHAPPQLQLVIATRADPPFSLARLRAQGQLMELRAADLRFTEEEAAAFLEQVLQIHLSSQDLTALESRTEGWIVGLQLAALSLQGRDDVSTFVAAFSGSHHYVLEYLTEEVLNRQPDYVQRFLLHTSILKRLCGPLCDALTGRDDGVSMLEHLQRNNLFIVSLDAEQRWYRYHHLFAELLRNRLQRETDQSMIADLHRHASRWYADHDLLDDAIDHALQAGDHERVVALIKPRLATSTSNIEVGRLMTWIDALPEGVVRQHPWLCIFRAWSLALMGQFEAAAPWWEAAIYHPEDDTVRGNVAILRAYAAYRRGDWGQAEELVQLADERLPEFEVAIRGMVAYVQGCLHYWKGELAEAELAFITMRQIGEVAGNILVVGAAISELAAVRKLQGRLGDAAALYDFGQGGQALRSVPLVDIGMGELLWQQHKLHEAQLRLQFALDSLHQGGWWGAPADLLGLHLWLAQVLADQGDHDGAWVVLEGVARQKSIFPHFEQRLACGRVELWLAQGEIERAGHWADTVVSDAPLVLHEQIQILRARVKLAQGRPRVALDILAPLTAEEDGRFGPLVEILALRARAYHQLGDSESAQAYLSRSLDLADGQMRVFLGLPDALRRFDPGVSLPEPLTEREYEVLRLIGAGYTNRQIAQELVITLNTVKKHSTNIYGKLGVTSRTQAIIRAQELGLI